MNELVELVQSLIQVVDRMGDTLHTLTTYVMAISDYLGPDFVNTLNLKMKQDQ